MNSRARASRIGIVLVVVAFVTAVAVVPRLSSTADEPPSHFDDHIAELEQALAETTAPAARELLEEKLRLAEEDRRLEMEGREALLQPGLEDTVEAAQASTEAEAQELEENPPPTPEVTPAGDGFITRMPVPPMRKTLDATSTWVRRQADGPTLAVYAGYLRSDPGQGALEVWHLDKGIAFLGEFRTSEPHGALTVTGAEGSVVILTAEDGTMYRFDADALAYVE